MADCGIFLQKMSEIIYIFVLKLYIIKVLGRSIKMMCENYRFMCEIFKNNHLFEILYILCNNKKLDLARVYANSLTTRVIF